jgi:hypothetical protein
MRTGHRSGVRAPETRPARPSAGERPVPVPAGDVAVASKAIVRRPVR